MELNRIATGIKLVGTTIKEISVENNIVNVQKEAKRSFGLNINEPSFENIDEGLFSQMAIDFEVEIEPVSYTHLRDHETLRHLVIRLQL